MNEDNELSAAVSSPVRPRQGVGQMAEANSNTGQVGGTPGARPAGLYRHPQSGAEIVTNDAHPFGDTQARAAERTGFVYVGPAPEGYVKELGAPSDSHEANVPARQTEAVAAYNKGVEARLNALEAENARLRAGSTNEGTEAKQAAADKTAEQTGVQVDPETGSTKVEPKSTESDDELKALRAEAKELGLDARGSKDKLTQRVAEAKAEKEGK